MRLPFQRVRPETVISRGAASAADLHETPHDEGKTAEEAKPKPQIRPFRRHADRIGGGPENEPADKGNDDRTAIKQKQPPARAVAVMQPLDAYRDGGDEHRQVDDKAQDLKRQAVAQQPADQSERDADNEKDQQREPIFGPVDAAAKAEQQRSPIHPPLLGLRRSFA